MAMGKRGPKSTTNVKEILRLHKLGMSSAEIAERVKVSRVEVNRRIRAARDAGTIPPVEAVPLPPSPPPTQAPPPAPEPPSPIEPAASDIPETVRDSDLQQLRFLSRERRGLELTARAMEARLGKALADPQSPSVTLRNLTTAKLQLCARLDLVAQQVSQLMERVGTTRKTRPSFIHRVMAENVVPIKKESTG